MILCDRDLRALGPSLIYPYDETLVNPASIDIRVGLQAIHETYSGWIKQDLAELHEGAPYFIAPKDFILVETYERIMVPNGYAIELKLKSSLARAGLNHSLAFWFDPGWHGIGTFELMNVTRYHPIGIWPGMRIAQIIVHRLSGDAVKPYSGRYQGATGVEGAVPEER